MHPPCPLLLSPPLSPGMDLFCMHWTTTESQWQTHIFKYQLESRSERQGFPSHPWANLLFYAKTDDAEIKTKWVMRWLNSVSSTFSCGRQSILWESTRTLILDKGHRACVKLMKLTALHSCVTFCVFLVSGQYTLHNEGRRKDQQNVRGFNISSISISEKWSF